MHLYTLILIKWLNCCDLIILILKFINSKWPKRLEEAKTDTSKKQHLLDDCSAISDDVMLLHKEASKERLSLTKYNKYYTTQGRSRKKNMTEAMSVIKLSSEVF